jgi:hypothetical protein
MKTASNTQYGGISSSGFFRTLTTPQLIPHLGGILNIEDSLTGFTLELVIVRVRFTHRFSP